MGGYAATRSQIHIDDPLGGDASLINCGVDLGFSLVAIDTDQHHAVVQQSRQRLYGRSNVG